MWGEREITNSVDFYFDKFREKENLEQLVKRYDEVIEYQSIVSS